MRNKLSVIIPFYFSENKKNDKKNNFSLLAFKKCLSAVFNSSYRNFEVIAVSDGSSVESIKLVKKYPCKLINIKKNSGAGFARNLGAKKSIGNILIFLDSDVEIKTNALKIINDYFSLKKNHGMIQGIYSNKIKYKSYTNEYLQCYYSYYIFTETKKHKFTQSLITNIFAIKRKIFEENKGFDSKFSGANLEDQEFGFRLQNNGHKIPILRNLNTIHHVNFGIIEFIKKITNIQIGEMKMHLRHKKTFIQKYVQKNYWGVIYGLILISTIIGLIFINLFFKTPFFSESLILLNSLFLGIHLGFLKYVFLSKGFFSALRSIFYCYLHRIIVVNCAICGLIDFYVFGKKY